MRSPGSAPWTPTPEWKRDDYEFALLVAIKENDANRMQLITEAFMNSKFATLPDSKERWETFAEWVRLLFSRGGSLETLKAMAERNPHSSGTLEQLGLAFAHFQEHMKAGNAFERAADIESDPEDQHRLLARAALQFSRAGEDEKTRSIFKKMKAAPISSSGKGEMRLLRTLQQVAERRRDDEAFIAFSERILELAPEDTKLRFSLAFKCSEVKNSDLAVFHFLRIPVDERDSYSWNNLGVEFENAGLSGKSVSAYKRSEELGETLASSNLAKKLLNAGFVEEAQQKCDEALRKPDYQETVPHTLAEVRRRPGEEDEKQSGILERAKAKSEFHRQFGRAAASVDKKDLPTKVLGPDCVLQLVVTNGQVLATGSYEKKPGLAALLGNPFGVASPPRPNGIASNTRGHCKVGQSKPMWRVFEKGKNTSPPRVLCYRPRTSPTA